MGVVYILVSNTLTNMEERGITSGFGFLGNTAGFSIQQTLIEYSEEDTYGRALVVSPSTRCRFAKNCSEAPGGRKSPGVFFFWASVFRTAA